MWLSELRKVAATSRKQSSKISVYEVAQELGVDHSTVVRHLDKTATVRKLDKCVPHQMSESHRNRSYEACFALLVPTKQKWFISRQYCNLQWGVDPLRQWKNCLLNIWAAMKSRNTTAPDEVNGECLVAFHRLCTAVSWNWRNGIEVVQGTEQNAPETPISSPGISQQKRPDPLTGQCRATHQSWSCRQWRSSAT